MNWLVWGGYQERRRALQIDTWMIQKIQSNTSWLIKESTHSEACNAIWLASVHIVALRTDYIMILLETYSVVKKRVSSLYLSM